MRDPVSGTFTVGLERSCARTGGDWVRHGVGADGLERHEAFFSGIAYEPHRHDTYAIGYTESGVQSFGYRGAEQHSLPGHVMIIHPDEPHDGHAGTEHGFRFRMLYLRPELIQNALDRSPLPFVKQAISRDDGLLRAVLPALDDVDRALEPLERDRLIQGVADALYRLDSGGKRRLGAVHIRAVKTAQDYLRENADSTVQSETLETVTGMDRYELSRHFKKALGTSPYRYLVMRRLEKVRSIISNGGSLADASAAAGFADQSHMSRHFKKAYGLTPGRWLRLCRQRDLDAASHRHHIDPPTHETHSIPDNQLGP